jgi:hypothetical protein
MKTFVVAAAALAVGLSTASAQSIGGEYSVQGTNLDGSSYTGDALITLTSDTTCTIQWKTGSTTSDGICSRNDDAFAAGYVLGNSYGLVIYKVQDDGSLEGLWTIQGQNGTGTETLTPK